ncbi:receptor-like protein 3 [Pyrus x bretschneideri]|uniref:receptor-like protein 3 n=1 Tax=Pyrus x bretschneideri TaxID=225117 RepID=UPI0020305081|nr:receptor-like protein 3 [Pyrus x bretschneideri]
MGGMGEIKLKTVFRDKILRADHNNLLGSLPEDIYNATKLEEFALPLNSLNGAISERIANLANLTILDFYFNHLSGVIPINFGKLSKLKFMNFDFNSLEGSLPPSLIRCTNLLEIHLGFNYLEGDLTTLNFSKLSHLSKLDLVGNNFTGILLISLYSCKSLKAIRLSGNCYLEGKIHSEILSLESLSFLSLAHARLTNITGTMKILMGCKSLHTFFLIGSFDREAMPTDDGIVDFHSFQNLFFLSLVKCGLASQIPDWLSNLKNLEILFLGNNQITGSIPSWLGTLPKLFYVDLSLNQISGEFPKELCRLPMLQVLMPTILAVALTRHKVVNEKIVEKPGVAIWDSYNFKGFPYVFQSKNYGRVQTENPQLLPWICRWDTNLNPSHPKLNSSHFSQQSVLVQQITSTEEEKKVPYWNVMFNDVQ